MNGEGERCVFSPSLAIYGERGGDVRRSLTEGVREVSIQPLQQTIAFVGAHRAIDVFAFDVNNMITGMGGDDGVADGFEDMGDVFG